MNNLIERVHQLTKRLALIAEGVILAEKNSRDSTLLLYLRTEEEAARAYFESEFIMTIDQLQKLLNIKGGWYASR